MKRLFPFFLLLLTTTATFPSKAGQGSSDLPELGDDASSVISPDQEYRLGRTWLRHLRGSTPAVSDPVV